MRILIRSLVATAFVLAVAIGGASSTLAATPGSSENANGAQTGGDTISGSGCFDDVDFVYCTDIRGRMHLVSTPGAKDLATLEIVEDVTVFDAQGNLVSSWKTVSHSEAMFGDDNESRTFEVSHTNVKDENHCTFTEFLRVVDYEIVLEKVTGPCA